MPKTAVALLDDLIAGVISLDELVEAFTEFDWADSPDYADSDDVEEPNDNSWEAISTDPRLSTEQYATLAKAYAKNPESLIASAAFKFDPNQPRDKDGQWSDGIVDVKAPKIPAQRKSGSSPGLKSPGGGGSNKKAIPAVIYKKHADDTVVATSGDGSRRMRWVAGQKKFVVDENKDGSWQETEALNKTSAYNELKNPDKWFAPGEQSVAQIDNMSVAPAQASVPNSGLNDQDGINSEQEYWDKYGDLYKSVKATTTEVAAIDAYTMNGFGLMNKIARGDLETIKDPEIADELDEWDQTIMGLDSFIRKQPPLQEDVTLFRGVDGAFVPKSGTWRAGGFTSTTWNPQLANDWAVGEPTPTVMEIRAKKGDQAWVSTPGPENEVIFPLDTKFTVISSEMKDGKRHVVVELAKPDQTGINNEPSTSSQTPEPEAPVVELTAISDDTSATNALSHRVAGTDIEDIVQQNLLDWRPQVYDAAGTGEDVVLKNIAYEQGWDVLPRLGSSADLDAAIAAGGIEVWRGVTGGDEEAVFKNTDAAKGMTAAEILDKFRKGPIYYGTGIYGNGIYAANQEVATTYANGKKSGIARMVIDPDAKIIDGDELETEYFAWITKYSYTDPQVAVMDDLGRFAAMRGYDAISQQVPSKDKVYHIILNRSALLIEDPDLSEGS